MTLRKAGQTGALSISIAIIVASSVCEAAQPAATNTPQPGQLSTGIAPIPATGTGTAFAAPIAPVTSIADVQQRHEQTMNRLWVTSMAAAVAGTSFDAATSWGKTETNPLLKSSSGTFGAKGVGVKAALTGAMIVPQLCLRKHKDLREAFTIGNFADAGVFSGIAVHNLAIRQAGK